MSWLNSITMFPDQYSSMPYFSRPPVFTYTNPPRSFHRQPPSPPGGSPGTSSGQLADSPPPVKSDYDDAREYSLLHPSDQSAGYPHAMHGVSEMGGGMGYAPGSLDLSFPSVCITPPLPTPTYNMFLSRHRTCSRSTTTSNTCQQCHPCSTPTRLARSRSWLRLAKH